MKKHKWVVIDVNPEVGKRTSGGPVLGLVQKCLRCGGTYPIPSGEPLDFAVDVMKAFLNFHKKCEEQK